MLATTTFSTITSRARVKKVVLRHLGGCPEFLRQGRQDCSHAVDQWSGRHLRPRTSTSLRSNLKPDLLLREQTEWRREERRAWQLIGPNHQQHEDGKPRLQVPLPVTPLSNPVGSVLADKEWRSRPSLDRMLVLEGQEEVEARVLGPWALLQTKTHQCEGNEGERHVA